MIKLVTTSIVLMVIYSQSLLASEISKHEKELELLVHQSPKLNYHKLIEYNERKLERIFDEKLKNMPPSSRNALLNAQKKWWQYYVAENEAAVFENNEGSGSYSTLMEKKLYFLQQRIYQLHKPFSEGWIDIPKIEMNSLD